MAEEIWKLCEDFPLFEVSNHGKVRSIDRLVQYKNGHSRIKKGQTFKLQNMRGYKRICWTDKQVRKNAAVHRMVALTFIATENKNLWINHKDFNRSNNHVDNLEWCTAKHNYSHSREAGRAHLSGGPKGPRKLNLEQIKYIKNNLSKKSIRQIAIDLEVTHATIARYRDNYIAKSEVEA